MKIYGRIYMIVNLINGKKYIGQTIQTINSRFKKHINCNHNSMSIVRAIKKYGKENFVVGELTYCFSKKELNEMEGYYINLYQTLDKSKGYNIYSYENNSIVVSKSTKAKHKDLSSTKENKERMKNLGLSMRSKKAQNRYCSSKYIGVNKQRKGWGAEIIKNGKRFWLGTYVLESDAAKAKDIEELKYLGEKAILNFPELKKDYLNNNIKLNKVIRNKSGTLGVSYNKKSKKWIFSLKGFKVKSFKTKDEAVNYANKIHAPG